MVVLVLPLSFSLSSPPLSFSLSISLFHDLSMCLYICHYFSIPERPYFLLYFNLFPLLFSLFLCQSLCRFLSITLFVCLSVSLSLSLYLPLFLYISLSLSSVAFYFSFLCNSFFSGLCISTNSLSLCLSPS